MNFEMPNNEEKNKQIAYENRIKAIKEALSTQGYSKELDLEFVELWKNMPNEVSDETHQNIDEIRDLLMEKSEEKE